VNLYRYRTSQWCHDCRDRPAVKAGLCVACWVAWAHREADACLDEGDVAWANWLRWEAFRAEGRLGMRRLLQEGVL
jgi:hypothetical protein